MIAFLLHIVILSSSTLLVVLGYNLVFGRGKILHFGQEAQSILAAYAFWVTITQFHQSWLVALLVCAALTIVLSLILTWLSLRLEPDGLGVMSIALHLAMLALVLNWQSVTRGALGIPRIPRGILPSTLAGYALMSVLIAAAWVALLWHLDRGSFGRKLRALAEHPWHAGAMGIDRRRIHLQAFLLAGLGSLLSNIFHPAYVYLLNPNDYQFPVMIFFVMVVVAGNPGSVLGATGSTFALIGLREALRFVPMSPDLVGPVRLILFGVILFVAVWLRRDTVFPPQRTV